MPVVRQSGPCIRSACEGRITFDHVAVRVSPDDDEIEVTRCPRCGLRHEREVKTGLVSARWDEDEPPEFDRNYYLA
jgi:hypothetical protein